MGLVLDSGVVIDAERNATSVSSLLAAFALGHGEAEMVLSAISVIELEHGYWRATTPSTHEMAQLAGKIDATEL
jgi:predicted nucleic acid-binding protein